MEANPTNENLEIDRNSFFPLLSFYREQSFLLLINPSLFLLYCPTVSSTPSRETKQPTHSSASHTEARSGLGARQCVTWGAFDSLLFHRAGVSSVSSIDTYLTHGIRSYLHPTHLPSSRHPIAIASFRRPTSCLIVPSPETCPSIESETLRPQTIPLYHTPIRIEVF